METVQPIIIKKYPNRRLYDTSLSQYVNLDYIRGLVVEHRDFKVLDSKTGADLTKTILLQIITESEISESQSLLTNTLLKQLIRFYGNEIQAFVPTYLEQSLATLLEQQDAMQGMIKSLVESGPLSVLGKMAEQNMQIWNQFSKPHKRDKEK